MNVLAAIEKLLRIGTTVEPLLMDTPEKRTPMIGLIKDVADVLILVRAVAELIFCF